MRLEDITAIAVLGAGTMGPGIAQSYAMSGRAVRLYDISGDALDHARGMLRANLDTYVEEGLLTAGEADAVYHRVTFTHELRAALDGVQFVQETVAGKEITFAHVIGGPAPIIYQKLGLNPAIDYGAAAIGIMNMTPPESAVIAADIAVKSGDVYLGFADRFTGTVIITGELADVTSALTEIVNYFRDELGYVVCRITKR